MHFPLHILQGHPDSYCTVMYSTTYSSSDALRYVSILMFDFYRVLTRDIDIAIPSVYLSVCLLHSVFGLTHRRNLFTMRGSQSF